MPEVVITDLDGNEQGRLILVDDTVRGDNEYTRNLIRSVVPVDPDTHKELDPQDGLDYLLGMLLEIGRGSYTNANFVT